MTRNIRQLSILLALSGCALGPDYREAKPQLPERWQAAPATQQQNADVRALQTWWQSFADAELDALMRRAFADNLDVKIALARVDQARAERRGTRAELFPTVNAVSSVQRQSNPFPGLAPGIKYNMFELGFDALWEIDLFGRLQRRSESAAAELDAAGEQYRQSLVTLSA
jgi:outer membrane protein TolC